MSKPLCKCHGLPQDMGGKGWFCAEKRRARQRRSYHAAPAERNWIRTAQARRARIRAKKALITELEMELEALLHEEEIRN